MNEYIEQYKSGNEGAYDVILELNMGVIHNVIATINIISYDKNDLFQEACIILMDVISKYDTSKEMKFSNFLAMYLRSRLLDLANSKSNKNRRMLSTIESSEELYGKPIEDSIIYRLDIENNIRRAYSTFKQDDIKILENILFDKKIDNDKTKSKDSIRKRRERVVKTLLEV